MSRFVRIQGASPQETIRFSRTCNAVAGPIGHIRKDGQTASIRCVRLFNRASRAILAILGSREMLQTFVWRVSLSQSSSDLYGIRYSPLFTPSLQLFAV